MTKRGQKASVSNFCPSFWGIWSQNLGIPCSVSNILCQYMSGFMKTVLKTACTKIAGMFLGNRSDIYISCNLWNLNYLNNWLIDWLRMPCFGEITRCRSFSETGRLTNEIDWKPGNKERSCSFSRDNWQMSHVRVQNIRKHGRKRVTTDIKTSYFADINS